MLKKKILFYLKLDFVFSVLLYIVPFRKMQLTKDNDLQDLGVYSGNASSNEHNDGHIKNKISTQPAITCSKLTMASFWCLYC